MAELSEAAVGKASPWSVSTPRMKLLRDSVRLMEPGFAQTLSQRMPIATMSRRVVESAYRAMVVCDEHWIRIALGRVAFSQVTALVIFIAPRRALFDTAGRDARTIQELAADLDAYGGPAEQVDSMRNRHVARPHRGFIEASPSICRTPASRSTRSMSSGAPIRRLAR